MEPNNPTGMVELMTEGRLFFRESIACGSQGGKKSEVFFEGARLWERFVCLEYAGMRGLSVERERVSVRTGANLSKVLTNSRIEAKGSIESREK